MVDFVAFQDISLKRLQRLQQALADPGTQRPPPPLRDLKTRMAPDSAVPVPRTASGWGGLTPGRGSAAVESSTCLALGVGASGG